MLNFNPIGISTFAVPFIFVVLIIWISANEKHKRNQLKAEVYLKALEKGQPLPPDLFAADKRGNPLYTGIILTLVSIGISLMMWVIMDDHSDKRVAIVGIIPFLMGIAYLLIHFIEKKKKNQQNVQ